MRVSKFDGAKKVETPFELLETSAITVGITFGTAFSKQQNGDTIFVVLLCSAAAAATRTTTTIAAAAADAVAAAVLLLLLLLPLLPLCGWCCYSLFVPL